MRARIKLLCLLVAASCVLAPLLACRDANRWIKRLGFAPINPPSNLLAPGAIVMRRHGFGQIRLLCTAEESLGADFKASQSRTIGGRFSRGRQVGWKLSGDALKQVKIASNSDMVDSVHVKVANARIENITDVDVLLALPQRSSACATAMRRRQQQGWEVSMIYRCLRADVSYGIQYKDSGALDVEAKVANLQAVNLSLGGNFQATGSQSALAKNLIWGAGDDKALAQIAAADADVQALRGQSPIPSKRRSILLPEESLTNADPALPQADGGDEPSWGVSTGDEAADPIPGFDDAVHDAEPEPTSMQPPAGHGMNGIPMTADEDQAEPAADEPAKAPISPRSRQRQ